MPQPASVQSLQRGLDLLEAIVKAGPEGGLSLQQLAELVELKTTTTFNLARTLAERGYLRKSTGRPVYYTPGPALHTLAKELLAQPDRPFDATLLRLASRYSKWRFIIAQSRGCDLFCSHSVDPAQPDEVREQDGRVLAHYTTASSLCHQTFWPSERRAELEKQYPFDLYGSGFWESSRAFKRALERYTREGAVSILDRHPARMAVPLFNRRGDLIASLGASHVGSRRSRVTDAEAVLAAMRDEAEQLRAPLDGFHPAPRTQPTLAV